MSMKSLRNIGGHFAYLSICFYIEKFTMEFTIPKRAIVFPASRAHGSLKQFRKG
jgi:hypothetical protein